MDGIMAPARSVWAYLRFFVPIALSLGVIYALIVGPANVLVGVLAVLLGLSLAERLAGDDEQSRTYGHPRIFVWMLWTYFPVSLVAFWSFIWMLAHGHNGGDLFGLAALMQSLSGFDMIAAHAGDGWGSYLIGALLFSQIASIGSVSIGHELSHRTWEPYSVFSSRACSLFGLFTYYAIEHPYGHHFTVGTPADSSTALRGESVYRYFLRTAPQDYQTAWAIEKDRLDKLGLPTMTWRNRLLQGWAAEAALVLFVFAVSGLMGLFWFLLAVFNAHFGYKLGTYSQHYGIVRVPGSEIKAHHSWDSFNRVTNWFVDNIGRHSQHHLDPQREFWRLEDVHAPRLPHNMGYFQAIGLAIIPALWHRTWSPALLEWDRLHASPEERRLAHEANLRSGRPELMAAAAQAQARAAVA